MAGEDSKSSGELGEFYIANFLELIGWKQRQSNESISCYESIKHNINNAKKGRTTHGIDELYTYKSPMDSNTLIHSVISVKHNDKQYPTSPNSKFKEHFNELAYTVECFQNSNQITENRNNYNDIDDEQIIGLLFWIASNEDKNFSIISKVKNPRLDNNLNYERIHIIDNDRVTFITNCIDLIKNEFQGYDYNFYYFDTPNNFSDSKKQSSGKVLPLEMLNSNIQVFKLTKEKEVVLVIVLKDEYKQDILKRILGLAHRLSNNLTSNIQILFPKFEHSRQENINSIKSVKSTFAQKEFIDTTIIRGYDIGFKNTPDNTSKSINIPNETIKDEVDNGQILPYGEHLRNLLNTSQISESELKTLLKDKGIFFCDNKREHTVPVLTSLLLTPSEFNILKEYQQTKDDKEKRHESKFKTIEEPNVLNINKALGTFDLKVLETKKFKNYNYKTSKVSFIADKEKKQLTLTYEIERYSRNKSWSEQKDFFKGTIIIDCSNGNLEVIAKNISTAPETLDINRNLIKEIKNKLVINNIIDKTTNEEKILMNKMSNKEVLKFLLSFTDNTKLIDLTFKDISKIDIEIDKSISLPKEHTIKWMENKINKFQFDGDKVEDIELLTDDSNHQYLKCWGIVAKYEFDNHNGKGDTVLEFKFHPKNHEFFIQIEKCNFDKRIHQQKNIEDMILDNIDKVKYLSHKDIIEKKDV